MALDGHEAGRELLRRIAAGEVEATSLRNVARQLGMSPSGLQKVLDGSQSLPATCRKLERWYVWEQARSAGAGPAAEHAARVLVQGLPSASHPEALSRLGGILAESFAEAGVPAPAWVAQLLGAETESTVEQDRPQG